MRAHSQRRMIWILNGVLGVALVGVAAWFVLDVRKAIALPKHLKPEFADRAVEAFQSLPDGETSGPPLAVEQKELDEIDVPTFKQRGGGRYHWLYSGPTPPEPPAVEEVEGPKAPVISDLEKLGRVHLLIFVPPPRGETLARESVIAWKFSNTGPDASVEEFRPGHFLVEPGKERGNIRLTNVVPKGGGVYEITYDVYDRSYEIDEVPEGEASSHGSYEFDGRASLDAELQGRIRMPVSAKAASAAATGSAAGTSPTTAVVAGTPGTGEDGAQPPPAAEPPGVDDLEPTIKWEGARRDRARVEFDQNTYDYLRSRDAPSVAKTLKTQVFKDAQGQTVGLQITGLTDDSPARKFDVRRGDVLISIDGKAVGSRDDAVNIIQGMDENVRSVTVVILRDGKNVTYVIDPQDPKTRREARGLENVR